jgi:hypothetical protein
MTAENRTRADQSTTERDPHPSWTVVWIDSHGATLAGWHGGRPAVERMISDVPARRRATGHVRHDPTVRHGGGGPGQSAADTRRLEHLARFLDQVESRLPETDDLAILGPGEVAEHLEQLVRDGDTHHRRVRTVTREPAGRQTERQLIARLRSLVGAVPARRTVGAYRWSGPQAQARSGRVQPPRRVVEKRPASLPEEG